MNHGKFPCNAQTYCNMNPLTAESLQQAPLMVGMTVLLFPCNINCATVATRDMLQHGFIENAECVSNVARLVGTSVLFFSCD